MNIGVCTCSMFVFVGCCKGCVCEREYVGVRMSECIMLVFLNVGLGPLVNVASVRV